MKIALASLSAMALLAAANLAHAAFDPVHPRYADTRMKYCCLKSAEMGLRCCGLEAFQVRAQYDRMRAADQALASLPTCCAAAVLALEPCCGHDATAVQSDFAARFNDALPQVMAHDHLPACCAAAVDAHHGCCGKDAAALAATFAQEVAAAKERLKKMDEGC